jgi:hypothetical protein
MPLLALVLFVMLGAAVFTAGGGQGDLTRTETHINLNESLAWTHGSHLVQAGFQLPDWSRRGFYDRTNFGGTFFFAGLDAYAAGKPYAFTQQQGNGDLALLEKQVGTYIKDDWQLLPGLSIAYGLRYDWQNYFHDDNNVAPRFSVAYAPGNTSAGLDHQLQKTATLSLTYTGARGYHLFRSRDINAPLPPLYLARPDPAYGVIGQVESTGRQNSDSLAVTLRGRVTRWFNGQMQYTLSRVYNDTNGIASFPANDYDLSGEWARADFDRRHRFLLLGRVGAIKVIDLGVGLTLNSGAPYTETLGGDVYNNGRWRARPLGVGRNTLEGDGFAALDVRVSRDVKLGAGKDARAMTLGSPLFGLPVSARPPRQLQFSARFKF